MLVDLAINPFGAHLGDMVALAACAEGLGYGVVWVTDHFSGAVVGQAWSRDPFVCLSAMAERTGDVGLGVLVANMRNRHPAQLASAVNSLQSLAPGRVRLGIGSGAAPGSTFAVEHEAIGTNLGTSAERRAMLRDSIASLRAIWAGATSIASETHVGFHGLFGVVDGAPCPPIIVGASAWPTVELAVASADGVNLRRTPRVSEYVARIRELGPETFEVSMLDGFDEVVREPQRAHEANAMGVDRLVLGLSVPLEPDRLAAFDLDAFRPG